MKTGGRNHELGSRAIIDEEDAGSLMLVVFWGLAVVAAESSDEVHALGDADPAVVSGLARFQVCPMPGAIVARAEAA